jgi:hypothetical protein
MISTIGYFRFRHFPSRCPKKAGAKYMLICKMSDIAHEFRVTIHLKKSAVYE